MKSKLTPAQRLHQCPIPIVGLTGGVASGKSTVLEIFRKNHLPVLCADQMVKILYQKPSTLDFIRQHFPEAVEGNKVLFPRLRQTVFDHPEKKTLLENFLHPRIPAIFQEELGKLENGPFLVYDIPLLFEKNLESQLDFTVCVDIDPELQLQRLMSRDQLDRILALKMIAAQHSMADKRAKADFTIVNNGSREELEAKTQDLIKKLLTD